MLGGAACSVPPAKPADPAAVPSSEMKAPMPVTIKQLPGEQKVAVYCGDQLFTAYNYGALAEKPVLYPIVAPGGLTVTRGFPLEQRAGERVDHPHHVGYWFTYGDVNGLDFWNNSSAIPADKKAQYGSILHRSVEAAHENDGAATLSVSCDWVNADGQALLREKTTFSFRDLGNHRLIDRITTLTANGQQVDFKDNKEGVVGLRVTRALELPSNKAEIFTDASGNPTAVPVLNNEGVTGNYLSSEGLTGEAVWGTRGRWMRLNGQINGKAVALTLLDHPSNTGYPTYWHARGYGLFAANPLGQSVFSNGKETLNFSLAAGQSTTFRYRLVVSGETSPDAAQIEKWRMEWEK